MHFVFDLFSVCIMVFLYITHDNGHGGSSIVQVFHYLSLMSKWQPDRLDASHTSPHEHGSPLIVALCGLTDDWLNECGGLKYSGPLDVKCLTA
jgi:hypothetical protein